VVPFPESCSAEGAFSHVGPFWCLPARSSCQAQPCERCTRIAARLIGHDPQLKNSHAAEFDSVVLSLAYCPGRAKIPLLTNNFAERPAAIR